MDESVAALMRANLHRVFGERDAARRAEAVRDTYAADVVFTDEVASVSGHDAVSARAQELLDRVPGDFEFAEDGPVYGTAERAALAWRFGPPGGQPVARGLDIATLVDGRIVSLETLLER